MQIQKQKNLSIRKIHEELFILDRSSSDIHTFNSLGTFIWERLQLEVAFDELVQAIIENYEIDEETALKDAQEFIQELERKKLVIISE